MAIVAGTICALYLLVLGISHVTGSHAIVAISLMIVLAGVLAVLYFVVLNVKHWLDCRER
jgi:hypothetical protein